jgi:dTMP kinase
MYIAIEGIDCSGKSTQISMLKSAIKDAVFTYEPGATTLGAQIRSIVLGQTHITDNARFLLFLADRAEHFTEVIEPSLMANKIVISDRSFISGIAYHLANTPSCDIDILLNLNKFTLKSVLPNKIIFLNISQSALQKRLSIKKLDAIEAKGIDYMINVQRAIKTALIYSKIDFLEIDGELSPQEIYLKIMDFIC